MSDCKHEDFDASVGVGRLTETEGGPVTGYMADIRLQCKQCGLPFEFLGLQPGLDTQGATVSIDGQEAHIAIAPKGARPNPLHRMGFGIRRMM